METVINKTRKDLIKETLLCPMCLDVLQLPVSLPCAHTFCRSCVQRLGGKGNVICPCCRRQHTIDVHSLNVNTVLASLLESLALSDKVDRCAEHSKKLNVFCFTCTTFICTHCALLKHEKTHELRSFKEFLEVLEEMKKTQISFFQTRKRKCSHLITQVNEKIDEVSRLNYIIRLSYNVHIN